MATTPAMNWKKGGCHCGTVRFEVLTPDDVEVLDCNCSICAMTGYLHLIVPKERFRLLSGEHAISIYEFNTKTAKHMFCSNCGIKSFYVPRSHPDGYSVNARCLERSAFKSMRVTPFDGQDWEHQMSELSLAGSV